MQAHQEILIRVDPQLRARALASPAPRLSLDTLADVREAVASSGQSVARRFEGPVEERELWVDCPHGVTIRCLAIRPIDCAPTGPAILHIHGGGFVCGVPEMQRAYLADLAAQLSCTVVSVDYRLAPETPAPGAMLDCAAVLNWMRENEAQLEIDANRIAVLGESAGGGLAAAMAIMLRDKAEIQPLGLFLMAPMLDDRTGTRLDADIPEHRGVFDWDARANRFAWSAALGNSFGSKNVSPWMAPSRCMDLAGLPPTFISVGELDLFLDEGLAFASRLAHSGIRIELNVYPGAFHGFELDQNAEVSRLCMAKLEKSLGWLLTSSV